MHLKFLRSHYEADDLLEKGVLAELRGEPRPELFRAALLKFEEALEWAQVLDRQLGELTAIHQGKEVNPLFMKSLGKILAEHPPVERVQLHDVRYANIARMRQEAAAPPPMGKDLMVIVADQRHDLGIVSKQLRETVEAFRNVLPLAEEGQFAALMLSGRAGFADKIQQSVELVETFARYYSLSCMTTIAATMQVYPSGLEWLKAPPEKMAP